MAAEVTVVSAGAVLGLLAAFVTLLAKGWPILRKVQRVHDDVLGDATAPDGDPRREPLRHVVARLGEKVDAASASAERAREESRLSREENSAQHAVVSERLDALGTKVDQLIESSRPTDITSTSARPRPRPRVPRAPIPERKAR